MTTLSSYDCTVTSKHLKGRLVPRVRHVFGSTTIRVIRCTLSVTFLDQQQCFHEKFDQHWINNNAGHSVHPVRHIFGSTTTFS